MLTVLSPYMSVASNWNPADGNADGVKSNVKFWKLHKDQMPSMCKFIRYAYTITTSSAPAERVFSVIKRSFDTGQKGALKDYVFLTAIIQFNKVDGTQDIKMA
jgi:hAT family C-terminal dimerisation region